MICKFCGNVIDDNSDFCFICGQKIPAAEIEAKVEKEENNDVFSQAAPEVVTESAPENVAVAVEATAPAAPEAPVYDDVVAPYYTQSAPIYAQSAPVYAQQAIIQQVAPAQIVKTRSPKDASAISKALLFFAALFSATFILQFIPWIWYNNAKKAGYENKATTLLNTIMIGLCIFMVIVCLAFVKMFML